MIVQARIIGHISIFIVKAKPGCKERFYYSNKSIISLACTAPCCIFKMSKFMLSRGFIWGDWEITVKGELQ